MLVHAAGHAEREGAKKANSRRRKKREVGGEKERATSDAESVTGIVT